MIKTFTYVVVIERIMMKEEGSVVDDDVAFVIGITQADQIISKISCVLLSKAQYSIAFFCSD